MFGTSEEQILKLWDDLQTVQANISLDLELPIYFSSSVWLKRGGRVLDVGSGNGHYILRLRDWFPDKTYYGIDTSTELIESARDSSEGMDIDFSLRDYFDEKEDYDFVVMRLFWQHVEVANVESGLDKLGELVKSGGSAFVIESHDLARKFYPDIPGFRDVIDRYKKYKRRVENKDRDIADLISSWTSRSDKWTTGMDRVAIIPSSIKGNLQKFVRMYEIWVDLFDTIEELEIDIPFIKEEIREWSLQPRAFGQIGVRMLRLDRL